MKLISYQETVNWIHSTLKMGIKPGLKRMELMMEMLDHPERKNIFIHVAGTNGKGSTVTFIRNILSEAGYQVGTFTSPYIETFNERISINGIPISEDDLIQIANEVKVVAEEVAKSEYGHPSEFELITAMMFLYFGKYRKIDIGVIEVGLGGRLDSTNILCPVLSVITTIGMDHTEFLGDTLEKIAYEKAGIIKQGVPIISGVLQGSVQKEIQQVASVKSAPYLQLNIDFYFTKITTSHMKFSNEDTQLNDITVGLFGDHQLNNASLAIEAILTLNNKKVIQVPNSAIYNGISKAFWPGRMEQLGHDPIIYLDGAHNAEGVEALVASLAEISGSKIILTSILSDKNYVRMIELLKTIPDATLCLTTFDFPRAMSKKQLLEISQEHDIKMIPDWQKFLIQRKRVQANYLVITGSLYFISEVRTNLIKMMSV